MALRIKDPEADRLARELAKETGESLTTAITVAPRELDARTDDEVLGYDEHGIPF